jgi:folylpolyglutamate synthase/dihydropteroate synthase
MEVVNFHDQILVLDGSHNEQKIEALVESMKNHFPDKKVRMLVSFGFVESRHESILASMKLLSQLGQDIIVTDYAFNADSKIGLIKVKQLGDIAKQAGFKSIIVQPNPKLAFQTFADNFGDLGLVTGSFYLLRPVRDVVFKHK